MRNINNLICLFSDDGHTFKFFIVWLFIWELRIYIVQRKEWCLTQTCNKYNVKHKWELWTGYLSRVVVFMSKKWSNQIITLLWSFLKLVCYLRLINIDYFFLAHKIASSLAINSMIYYCLFKIPPKYALSPIWT